ncbi:hypothetical protein CLOBOL_05415 [Enterocloster bolteae ATCC BAA-613]|uniref:Uncharacterized protein n=1 Tax=Enterocloster bolteae (strain ATCC BAA-613 / DSM 15670 / CCUG 46953 / JCM 12243 / WAL 16351) TaxID=411902 RepID=A8RZH0_ENTBW|nr:hypothetical protein CLOBOL_05415 [Enterocloster bolteae ATCC BAA-613]
MLFYFFDKFSVYILSIFQKLFIFYQCNCADGQILPVLNLARLFIKCTICIIFFTYFYIALSLL